MSKKVSMLQCILTVVFVCCLLISNIVVIKSIALPFGGEITGALYIFPITYILSDVFSEVYGYKWSRITCYLAFIMNIFMAIVFALVIASPGTEYFTSQAALEAILGNTPRLVFASLAAFAIGDFANDRVFRFMKKGRNNHKGFCFRAIASSVVGALCDTFIFYLIGFTGMFSVGAIVSIALTEMVLKVGYELLILPVTTFVMHMVSKHEKKTA